MNFLKHVVQQLDDHSLGLLGAVLGENESRVRAGVKSAVPKILDSMVSATNTEEGRDMLWRELRDTDASVASSFSKQMYYKDSQTLVANGHDQLEGLIGAEAGNLIQSVSRESDIGSTSAKRIVGALTPLVFASVANHQQSKQLNQNELGDVIAQQKSHLSAWQRQSDHYFAGAANDEDQNEPLFSSLPTGSSKAPLTATAVGSAALGVHHFSDHDTDQNGNEDDSESDSRNLGRSAAYGSQSKSRLESENQKDLADPSGGVEVGESLNEYDRRSNQRRQRDAIAAHPANAGFAANVPEDGGNLASKSVAAGSIAAAGAGAAAVIATAISPAAKAQAEAEVDAKNKIAAHGDFKANSDNTVDRSLDDATNTYDSKNPVSGFAAANLGASGEAKTPGNDAGFDGSNKRLWTPDSADGQRAADGTLQYSDKKSTDKDQDGWFRFHWLWWPVLILGSLYALSLVILDPDNGNTQTTDQDQEAAVIADDDSEPVPTAGTDAADTNNATAVAADDQDSADPANSKDDENLVDDENSEEVENTSELSNSDPLGSGIEITASQPEAATDANDTSMESAPELAPESSDQADQDAASQTQDQASTITDATDETSNETSTENSTEAKVSNQDDMPSLQGNVESNDAGSGSEVEGIISPESSSTDLGLDADEQVEELLSAIETELADVSDEAQAKAAEASLSGHISGLEQVLANRAQWKDEIEILVDFQLEEGQKMIAVAKENVFESEAVKETLKGKFEQLNRLMKTSDP